MTPEQKRTFNTTFGSLFLAIGLCGWGLAAYYAVTPAPPRPAPVMGVKNDVTACQSTLRRMGYETRPNADGSLRVFRQVEFNPSLDERQELRDATLAASVCNMKLEEFCFGTACKTKGIEMTLAPLFRSPAGR